MIETSNTAQTATDIYTMLALVAHFLPLNSKVF